MRKYSFNKIMMGCAALMAATASYASSGGTIYFHGSIVATASAAQASVDRSSPGHISGPLAIVRSQALVDARKEISPVVLNYFASYANSRARLVTATFR